MLHLPFSKKIVIKAGNQMSFILLQNKDRNLEFMSYILDFDLITLPYRLVFSCAAGAFSGSKLGSAVCCPTFVPGWSVMWS